MNRGKVRGWYWVHKWTSLVCTLFLLILCVTGLPLIFGDEIYHLSTGGVEEVPPPPPGGTPVDLDTFIARATALYPGDVPLFLGWDADHPTVYVNTGARRDRARSKTEGSAGQVDQATTFRAGLIGEIGWGVAPYVSYSESFLPVAGLDFNNVAFVPVRGRQYEAGVKWQPARGALLTASASTSV